MFRLLLKARCLAMLVKGHNAEAVGVLHGIGPQRGNVLTLGAFHCIHEHAGEALTVENVVTQDEAHGVLADKFLADNKGLGQSFGTGLLGVLKAHADVLAGP